jgi:bifunctional polynucleotide phosphatase/kinase
MPKLHFKINDEYIMGMSSNFNYNNKLAMFDLDYTLIKPKSNKKISLDPNDWKFLYNNVPEKLEEYYNRNYTIIIISNQLKMKSDDLQYKLNNIYNEILKKIETKIEIIIFVATKKNKFRKPSPSFFKVIEEYNKSENENYELNKKNFFCGDASGRKGDHSDCDYKFALNCNVIFKLPEEIFDNKTNILLPTIDYPDLKTIVSNHEEFKFSPSNKKEIVIMIGYPASGKSTIAKKINKLYDYEIINQDTLKTKAKCHKMVKEFIKEGKSIVIDNTNPNIETREFYINIAKENNYFLTAIHMKTSYELSMHNNYFRNTTIIPEIVYRIYKNKFSKPSLEEGFDIIIKQNIIFNKNIDLSYFYYLY